MMSSVLRAGKDLDLCHEGTHNWREQQVPKPCSEPVLGVRKEQKSSMAEAQGPRKEVRKGHWGPERVQDGLDVDMNLEEERFYIISDHQCH